MRWARGCGWPSSPSRTSEGPGRCSLWRVRETVSPTDVLQGDLDPATRATVVPPSYQVKGMFFSRLKGKVGDAWDEIARNLEYPPRFGHYVPFRDYPQSDYLRLSIMVAERAYPGVSLREGMRRVARDDFDVFAGSTFGRVVLAAVGDVHRALLTMAEVYKKMASGDWDVRASDLGPDVVVLEWVPSYGCWEYQLGQIEGLIRYYGADYEVRFSMPVPHHFRFEVHHGR
jgi:uncharacterized protein (TIGR02265 family)